jgi:hypothetical protein
MIFKFRQSALVLSFFTMVSLLPKAHAELSLETETARVNPFGAIELGSAFRYQSDKDGHEFEQLEALEFGMPANTEFLFEWSPWVELAPKKGARAVGMSDLSLTFTWLAIEEKSKSPAVAFALETKAPTARNRDIGTGREDYSILINFSKNLWNNLELHANIGGQLNGDPKHQNLRNQALFTVAAEFTIPKTKWEIFGEVVEQTASRPSRHADFGDPNIIFGDIGVRYHAKDGMLNPFIRATYDNQHAVEVLIGITTHFGKKEKDDKEQDDKKVKGK